VNADSAASAQDIIALIDILNEVDDAAFGLYSADVDHSEEARPADILRVIDLLNGADLFAQPWVNTSLPVNDSCP
jgi:hypothetical protein